MPGRILIVDDVVTHRILLQACLAAAAYQIEQTASAAAALAAARARPPDLVLVSDALPDASAVALCHRLRALPGAAALPVLLIGDTAQRATRLAVLEAGIDAFLDRSTSDDCLLARVRNLLRRGAAARDLARDETAAGRFGFAEGLPLGFAGPGQITLIAPALARGLRWRNALRPLMRDRIEVLTQARALSQLGGAGRPDAVVIAADPDRPDQVLRLLSDLSCRDETRRAAVVLVQTRPDPGLGILALDLGVSDLVETGFNAVEMALRLRRELARKARADRCHAALKDSLRLAATDPLTGLFNRRYAMTELERIIAGPRPGRGFAVMVLDLDRFKRINDRLGHAAGDAVLTEVARRMNGCLRGGDFLARIGGEEFLAVIRNCDRTAASRAAERLRRVVSATPVEVGGGAAPVTVTLSIGLVLGGAEGDAPTSAARMTDLADKALYASKAEGRNQVTLHRSAA